MNRLWTESPTLTPPFPTGAIEASKALLEAVVAHLRPLRDRAGALLAGLPQFRREFDEYASAIGVDPLDLMLANCSYDLAMSFGCTTTAIETPSGPLLFRNMDWYPEVLIARASAVVPTPFGRNAGFPGMVGVVSGIAQRGFALSLNAVGSIGEDRGRYPMLLFLRTVLDQAADFTAAVAMLQREALLSGGMITIVGTQPGERAVVERTPTEAWVRRPKGTEPLITTNHMRTFDPAPTACPRLARMYELVPFLRPSPSHEELLYLLYDPKIMQSITAQHVIAQPATGTFRMFVPTTLLG